MLVFEKPPVICSLRPMTLADIEPGGRWVPGMTILEIRHVDDNGCPKEPEHMILRLSPGLRENTTANVKEVIGRIRAVSDEVRDLIDQYAILHQPPPTIGNDTGRHAA